SLLIEAKNSTAVQSYQQIFDAMDAPIELRSVYIPNGLTGAIWEHETTHGVSAVFLPSPTAIVFDAPPPAGILVQNQTGLTIAAHITVGNGRVVVMTDWLFSDIAINAADNRRFANRVFGWLSGTLWIDVAPLTGTLPPGQTDEIVVWFDSGELPPDAYELQLDLVTNDPARPLIKVPLTMRVEPLVVRQLDLAMDAGLNLRSWNVELEDDSTTVILAPVLDAVESVQGFDGGGLTFDPSIPSQFNTLKTMDHLHGYWFRLHESATLALTGFVSDHRTPIPLAAGYNLIGYLPDGSDSTFHAIASVIDLVDVVLGYDGGGLTFDPSIPPQFNTLQVMRPGFGYWIKLSEASTLVYPDSPVMPSLDLPLAGGQPPGGGAGSGNPTQPSRESVEVVPTREWISLWGDDVRIDGELITIGTAISAIDGGGVICGRCTAHEQGQFGLMAIYRDDPETVVDEGPSSSEAVTVVVGNHVFEGVEWTQMGDVINFTDVARLTAASDHIPQQSALHQNFPNPFNPATTIAYDLAAPETVKLTVFNVNGQRVRELISKTQPAGRYSAVWDGRDERGQRVASGVYFYRLEAGAYSRTLKMVLLK
ncbi:MAG: T9SS type A sorting domain-containing protein, partial [Candidatus Latescibacterota bacterium]